MSPKHAAPPPYVALVENIRRRQLSWLRFLVDRTGLTRTEIARKAGVSPSTLSKFENDPDNIAQLEAMTIRKIEAATGIPLQSFDRMPENQPRTLEAEATPYEVRSNADPVARALQAFIAGENAVVPWRLTNSVLESVGYLDGDVLLVDLNSVPRDGDVVCAQVYDWRGSATIVVRMYHEPFLTAPGTPARPIRPMLVNGKDVQLRGVVVGTIRPRTARPAA